MRRKDWLGALAQALTGSGDKDGSEQIIEDDDAGAYNFYVSMGRNSGENIWVPTKLIDVDQVVSVTLEGTRYTSTGETETEVPFTIVYS